MRILIISKIDAAAIARLRQHHDVIDAIGAPASEIGDLIADREVLVFRSGVSVSAELMRRAPDLRLIVRGGSGYDNVDLPYMQSRDIAFIRVPEPGARAVAELTFGLMLALARDILRADQAWRRGRWLKNEISGFLLRGKVLGVVGAGNIGAQVGELGALWGMQVIGCVSRPSAAVALDLQRRGIRLTDFDEVVATADFLTIHVALNDSTRNLIGREQLSRMKQGSFLLNLARGGVVDETALRDALVSGDRLRGAALDVHEVEGEGQVPALADMPNVILTPHIGSTTRDTQREIGERIVSIIEGFPAERPLAAGQPAR